MTDFEVNDYGIYSYVRISPEEEQQVKTLELIMSNHAFIEACEKWVIPRLRVDGNKVHLASYKELQEEFKD